MIRFIEMTGIDLDNVKSFGFWDTVTERLVPLGGGEYRFKSYKGFMLATKGLTGSNKARLDALIPNKWRNPEQADKMRYFAVAYEGYKGGNMVMYAIRRFTVIGQYPQITELVDGIVIGNPKIDAVKFLHIPTELIKEDYLSFIKN